MSTLSYLSPGQMARSKPCFPFSYGVPGVGDARVVSGIIDIIKHGLQWKGEY
ncbi:hypothetical protein [Desulfovibrio sp. ZJ200]|uniref:hypothetical protein n=1 Tax=Desulfovibrio sp. ZJ200 TaxID=2709792 RepID=UPI0013EC9682|nr:hypothetical protein [Desulfovibrio sp. ZJ200]